MEKTRKASSRGNQGKNTTTTRIQPSERKKGRTAGIIRIVVIIVLCAALIGGGVYLAWRLTDGFSRVPWDETEQGQYTPEDDDWIPGNELSQGEIVDGYFIELNGQQYGNHGVAKLKSGDTFTVSEKFGTDYVVTFTANAAHDFNFLLGAEPYTWHDVTDDDFTAGFTVVCEGVHFTVKYEGIEDIISAAKGNAATLPDGVRETAADKFTMTVTSQNGRSVSIGFVGGVEDVTVLPGDITFWE